MVVSKTTLKKWDSRAESFARARFRYLPSIERRLRELCDSGAVKKLPSKIPRYKLA